MKLYLCSVRLGDSSQHIVPNKPVTVPEIAVLRAIHGGAAVTDMRPYVLDGKPQTRDITDPEERERLARKYQRGDDGVTIDKLFGAMGALPKTLRDIGIDPQAAAAELRRKAEEMSASAARLADEEETPAEDEDDAFLDDLDEEVPATVGKKAAA